MHLFRKAAVFLLAVGTVFSALPSAVSAETDMKAGDQYGLVKNINAYVFVDKLIEGRDVQDSDVFTFHVEPVSEEAKEYAENGYLTYLDTITVGASLDPSDSIAEKLLQYAIDQYYKENPDGALTEEQIEAGRAFFKQVVNEELSMFSGSTDSLEGLWSAGIINITGREEKNDYGVMFPLIDDGNYTFRITEQAPESSDLITSKAVWELNINVNKPDKWSINWEPTYTLTRVTDDRGEADGTKYDITYVGGYDRPFIALDFSNTYAGSVLIQPADMTTYMNGEKGYGGVVTDGQTGAFGSADSLPEVGFYITLPDAIDDMLRGIWKDSDDIAQVEGPDGVREYVLDLSDYVTLKDSSSGRAWTLEMYGNGYSMAYNQYVYRLVSVSGQEPMKMQFTDRNGNIRTNDKFSVTNALFEQYGMEIYPGDVDAGNISAEIRIGESRTFTLPVEQVQGKLKVRYVTKEQSESVTDLVVSQDEVLAELGTLKQAVGIAPPDTVFYINESQIPVNESAVPSLLFDDVVSSEDGAGEYGDILKRAALSFLDIDMDNPQYEAKYIDLVDSHNGNAWLKASAPVTVYWPYPEGTDARTKFHLVHFKGLNREMQVDEVESMITGAEMEVMDVETDEHGIRFTSDGFSPFVLLWDSPVDTVTDTPDAPVPGSQTGGNKMGPSVKTGDTSYMTVWGAAAVLSFGVCAGVMRKKYSK